MIVAVDDSSVRGNRQTYDGVVIAMARPRLEVGATGALGIPQPDDTIIAAGDNPSTWQHGEGTHLDVGRFIDVQSPRQLRVRAEHHGSA